MKKLSEGELKDFKEAHTLGGCSICKSDCIICRLLSTIDSLKEEVEGLELIYGVTVDELQAENERLKIERNTAMIIAELAH